MKRAGILLLVVAIISLFNSCQKEDTYNSNVKLLVYEPEMTSSSGWTVSGRVISSGKLDLSEHGFDVVINGSTPRRFNFGALNKSGKIETILELLPNEHITGISMYAADQYGNYFTSNNIGDSAITPVIPSVPPATIVDEGDSSNNFSDFFYAMIQNPNNSYNTITQYGFEFRVAGTSNAWTTFAYASAINLSSPFIPVHMDIPKGSPYFSPGNEYEYKIYAINRFMPDGTETTIYSDPGTFYYTMP